MASSSAKACPNCGRPARRKTSLVTMILGGIFAFFVIVVVSNSVSSSSPTADAVKSRTSGTAHAENVESALPGLPAAERKEYKADNWIQSSFTDDMTDDKVNVFSLKSTNSVSFDFPYNIPGGSHLTINVRKGGKTFDAFLKVDKGQMICSYSDCGFVVRLNSGKPQNWKGLRSSTGNPDIVFVRDAKDFEKLVRNGGKLRIGLDFYHSGKQTFDFDLTGYPDSGSK